MRRILPVLCLAGVLPAQAQLAGLRARAAELLQPHLQGHPGAAISIGARVDGVEVLLGLGERPPSPDTVYEIGSITKVFTGILLAELAREGRLALEDPLRKHLPDGVAPPEGGEVKLVHLATHSSGLPRMPGNFGPKDGGDPYADYDEALLFAFLSECDLKSTPGERYEYSNLGAGLLGTLLARNAGADYETVLRQRVLAPLRLHDTAITLDPSMQRRLVPGHDRAWQPGRNWSFQALAPAGALRSTARDLLRFGSFCLAPGEHPLAAAVAQSHRVHFAPEKGPALGLGWHLSAHEEGEGIVVWHNGRTGAYGSFLGIDKRAGVVVVILVNDVGDVDRAGFALLEYLRR